MNLPRTPTERIKYIAGDPSLDFVNTVDWTKKGLVNDRFTEYARVLQWAEGAGVVSAADAKRLRRGASSRPAEEKRALESARALRARLQRVFAVVARGDDPRSAAKPLNEALAEAFDHLELVPARPGPADGAAMRWLWRGMGERLESVLWPVVWSAAELLTSDEAAQVRVCGGQDCGWMFVDRSRNRLRRWCEMRECGTREKSRRRRGRTRGFRQVSG